MLDKEVPLRHTIERGCDITFLRAEKFEAGRVNIYKCNNHKKELCRCGVELGKHSEYYKQLEDLNK